MAKSFPDLTGDGEVTKADILKAKGVFKKGGSTKFIQSAIKKPGALRASMGVKKGGKITVKNAVKTLIVFSKTSWIGTKAENPEEKPMPMPEGV